MQWRIPLVAVVMGFAAVLISGLAWENPYGTSEFLYGYPFHWLKQTPSGVYFQWTGFLVNVGLYSLLSLAVSFLAFTSKEKTRLLKFLVLSGSVIFVVSYPIIFELNARGPYGNPFGTAIQGSLLLMIIAAPAATIAYGYILIAKHAAEFKKKTSMQTVSA